MIEGQVLSSTAAIQFGEWPTYTDFVRPPHVTQVWVKQADNPDPQPLIWSPVGYDYELTRDGKYIIVDSLCYGGLLGRGMYSVQIETHQVITLHPTITHNCEGSQSKSLSPVGKNIVFTVPQGDVVVNLNDMRQMRLCGPEGSSGDYTWSADGRYVYVVCADTSGYYAIRRIDTDTFVGEDVTDRYQQPLGIFRMEVSPDAKRIAFYRLEESFYAKKHAGVWVLDLN